MSAEPKLIFATRPEEPSQVGPWLESVFADGDASQLADELFVMQSFADQKPDENSESDEERIDEILQKGFCTSELATWVIQQPERLKKIEQKIFFTGSGYWDRILAENLHDSSDVVPSTNESNQVFGNWKLAAGLAATILIAATIIFFLLQEESRTGVTGGMSCVAQRSTSQGTDDGESYSLSFTGRQTGVVYLIAKSEQTFFVRRAIDLTKHTTVYWRGSPSIVNIWTAQQVDEKSLEKIINDSYSGQTDVSDLSELKRKLENKLDTSIFVFPTEHQP